MATMRTKPPRREKLTSTGGQPTRKRSVDARKNENTSEMSPGYAVDFRDELVNLQLTDRDQKG